MAQGFRLATAAVIAFLGLSLGLANTPAMAGVSVLSAPSWMELTPTQKQILAPLGREWDTMEAIRRQKWLGIAKRYPSLSPEEQARLHQRMEAWARLSPEERTKAREKFKKLQKAPPEQKDALKQKWQEYQQLPPEEKQRLADQAKTRAAPQKHRATRPKPQLSKPLAPIVPPATATATPMAEASSAAAAALPPGANPAGPVAAQTTPPTPALDAATPTPAR